MDVLVVEPGYAPYEKAIDGLYEMQETVGGLIQAIYPYEEPVALVCNEEGLLQGLDFNRSVPGGYGGIVGTFFICGLGEEDFCSLTPQQMEKYRKEYHHAEILLGVRGNEPVTLKVKPKLRPDASHPEQKRSTPER